jgi:hypothetical protein
MEMAALRALLCALWAHVRKLLTCMRAPGQLLRLVLSLMKTLSRWITNRTTCSRSSLPSAVTTAREDRDSWNHRSRPSETVICASRVPDTLAPGMVFHMGPTDVNAGASTISLASTHYAHDETVASQLPYSRTQSRSTFRNVSAMNHASLHYLPRTISTPNLPGSRPSTRTGVRQAEARWNSARSRPASRVSGRRASPASNRSSAALTIVCHYVSPDDSIF